MTIQDELERKKWRVAALSFIGFALFLVGAAGIILQVSLDFMLIAGGVVMGLALLYARFKAFRCPRCGKNWGCTEIVWWPVPYLNAFSYRRSCSCEIDSDD